MSSVQSRGGLWEFLLRLFGASKSSSTSAAARSAAIEESVPDDEGPYVIAPGGYRIHVPQATDVNHCVGDMLPSVRDGLSILPPLPKVVTDLLREIQDPKSTASSVADIASSDPALAASLIRTVNAAAVGLSRKISSVSEAVSYLGFGAVEIHGGSTAIGRSARTAQRRAGAGYRRSVGTLAGRVLCGRMPCAASEWDGPRLRGNAGASARHWASLRSSRSSPRNRRH